ncbi:unnamed protein product, partial [Adineta steineri]
VGIMFVVGIVVVLVVDDVGITLIVDAAGVMLVVGIVDIKLTSIYKPQSRPRQRRRRRFPRSERNKFFRENEFIPQKQSSSHFPRNRDHHSSSDQQKNEDHKLKYLYEDYSSENVHKTWKPLPLSESRKLFEYALDKYHRKFRSI